MSGSRTCLASMYHFVRELLDCLFIPPFRIWLCLCLFRHSTVHEVLGQKFNITPICHTSILVVPDGLNSVKVSRSKLCLEFPAVASSVKQIFLLIQSFGVRVFEEVHDPQSLQMTQLFAFDDLSDSCGVIPNLAVPNTHQV